MVGESLVGEGNEVAHIDLLIGSKDGPVGQAFAAALLNQKEGHTNLLAVVAPNLPAKPDTLMANKVTIKGATQAVQMFGPAQAAVARAVVDSVREGVIPADQVDDLCIIVGVFIHWEADRRQEDLRLELPGDEGVDRPRPGRRAERAACSTARPRRGTRSPGEPRGSPDAARLERPRLDGSAPSSPARAAASAPASRRRSPAPARPCSHLPPQRGGRARGRRRHRGTGGRALVARADLGTRAGCEALVAEARERLGGLDVWVNNAGADVLTGDAAGWDWERKLDLLLAVDLKGTIACCTRPARRCASKPRGGAILNMSWDHATSGMAGDDPGVVQRGQGRRAGLQQEPGARARPARCASTSCVRAGSRPRSREQADPGFRALRGRVDAAASAGGRRRTSPAAALYLASPEAAFITGQAINVNGGVVM